MTDHAMDRRTPGPDELLLEYRRTGCKVIAEELLQHYRGMVQMAAGKMSRSRQDLFEDLFQVGQLSLFRLMDSYDPSLGIPFEAYAMKSIIGHMKNYLRDKSWYIQVPRRIKEKGLQVQQAVDELTVKLERTPKMEEIAAHLELTMEETIEILAGRECYQYVSLDAPLSADEAGATIGDMIHEEKDPYTRLEHRIVLEEAMEKLNPEEKAVLQMSFTEGKSQRVIAEALGVSQMSVSRIQRRAIRKLRPLLDDLGYSSGSG